MSQHDAKLDYESLRLLHPWWIAGGVVGFVLFTVAAMGLLYLLYLSSTPAKSIQVTKFNQPRLQIDPAADWARVKRQQLARLDSTQLRDRKAGTLVIPLEAAMAAVAARGPQAFAPLPNAPSAAQSQRPSGAMAPSDRTFNPGAGAEPDQ